MSFADCSIPTADLIVGMLIRKAIAEKKIGSAEAEAKRILEDAAKAADELRRKKAVILNMENVDKGLTRRVVDFLSGSVYALDGSVKKIAQSTYLFCPHNMDIVGDLETQIEMEAFV